MINPGDLEKVMQSVGHPGIPLRLWNLFKVNDLFFFFLCTLSPSIYSTFSRTLHMLGTQTGIREKSIKNVPDVWEDRCTNWQILVVMAVPELNGSYSYGHIICSDEFGKTSRKKWHIHARQKCVILLHLYICTCMWVFTCMDVFGGQRLKLECLPQLLCHLIFKTYLPLFDNFIGAQVVTDNFHSPRSFSLPYMLKLLFNEHPYFYTGVFLCPS